MRRVLQLLTIGLTLAANACTTTDKANIPVATDSVSPGTSVKRAGQPIALAKGGHLDLNAPLPPVALTTITWGATRSSRTAR